MKNPLKDKSYALSLEIIKIVRKFHTQFELAIGMQLLRSVTSISANYEEAIAASSKKDFIYKISICYKEARESLHWLSLLKDSNMVDTEIVTKLIVDCTEIIKMLVKSKITAENNIRNKI